MTKKNIKEVIYKMAKQALFDSYSIEELTQIAKMSTNWKEFSQKLGYTSGSGQQLQMLKEKVKNANIDVSHFSMYQTVRIERNRDNVFIENSTADQKTLRRYYCQELRLTLPHSKKALAYK